MEATKPYDSAKPLNERNYCSHNEKAAVLGIIIIIIAATKTSNIRSAIHCIECQFSIQKVGLL